MAPVADLGIWLTPRRVKPCGWPLGSCGLPATTRRATPTGRLVDVCERHAGDVERLTAHLLDHGTWGS